MILLKSLALFDKVIEATSSDCETDRATASLPRLYAHRLHVDITACGNNVDYDVTFTRSYSSTRYTIKKVVITSSQEVCHQLFSSVKLFSFKDKEGTRKIL